MALTVAQLTTLLNTNITDQLNGQNAAARVRQIIQAIIDSYPNSIDNPISGVNQFSITLSPAEVFDLNPNPLQIISTPGVGKYIKVLGTDVQMDYNSVPYDSYFEIKTDTATKAQFDDSSGLTTNASDIFQPLKNTDVTAPGTPAIVYVANKGVYISAPSPYSTGNSDITLYISYIIVDI